MRWRSKCVSLTSLVVVRLVWPRHKLAFLIQNRESTISQLISTTFHFAYAFILCSHRQGKGFKFGHYLFVIGMYLVLQYIFCLAT